MPSNISETTCLVENAIPVSLNELAQNYPGNVILERCLGRKVKHRDEAYVENEYNMDKYKNLLETIKNESTTPFLLRMDEFHYGADSEWCFSAGENLYKAPLMTVQKRFDQLLVDNVASLGVNYSMVVEMGCGYGYNLWVLSKQQPEKQYLGGDLAPTAVDVAKQLYLDDSKLNVCAFNYNDENYHLLEQTDEPILLITVHSIEQLPNVGHVFDTLDRYKDRIAGVIHFEPVYEHYSDSLLGTLRKAYTHSVDYNCDLLSELVNRSNINIEHIEKDMFGMNPLNPTSVIYWTFK